MGKPVTVDSDDLEVLVLASAATRKIEDMLATFQDDPAMRRVAGKIGQAHDRINRARAMAIKDDGGLLPLAEVKLTEQGASLLRILENAGPMGHRIGDGTMTEYGAFRAQRLVVMGQCNEIVTWGDKTEAGEPLEYQRVKITQRGIDWLKEHANG